MRNGRWEEGKGRSLASNLSPSHRPLNAFFFPITPVPLGNKEASAEERGIQAKITMTRAELNKQLVKENTTKTLYNGGALSCHARQIDSYYFIIATRQAREKKR